MWPSQWFMRIYGAEYSVVLEDLCDNVSGFNNRNLVRTENKTFTPRIPLS